MAIGALTNNLTRQQAFPQRLLPKHCTPFTAGLIVGLGWGAFHLLALLANPDQPWRYFAVSLALMLAMSVLMAWLFKCTQGSIPLMALPHAMYDTMSIAIAPLLDTGVALLAFALSAGMAWLVALALLALSARGRCGQGKTYSANGNIVCYNGYA